jgi:4-hydroxy-3-methylbut-2-enyl diphosphate reductase IspH
VGITGGTSTLPDTVAEVQRRLEEMAETMQHVGIRS